MTEMVDINVIIDEKYIEPKVDIYTRSETGQVEAIITAIEDAGRHAYPPVSVVKDGALSYISQRDIYRIHTEGREVILDTADHSYIVKGSITRYENVLDSERFFRISQSEIINLYKVDAFDFSIKGTASVTFDNAAVSWVSRRTIRPLRDKLKKSFGSDK